MKTTSISATFVALVALSICVHDLEARGIGRGGGGISRGGGGGISRPNISRPSPGRTPSMSRPAPRPSVSRPTPKPSTRPSIKPPSNNRPSIKPPTGGNKPTVRPGTGLGNNKPGNLPGLGNNRPGAGTRPSQGGLNNFLDLKKPGAGGRPSTLPSTRPGSSGAAISDFLKNDKRPGVGDRPSTLPSTRPGTGDRPGNGNRPGEGNRPGIGDRPGNGNRPGDGNQPGIGDRPGNGNRPGLGNRPGNLPNNRPNRITNINNRNDVRIARRNDFRNNFRDNHPRYDFWHRHPHWAAWRWNRPYRWATAAFVSSWFVGWGWNQPAYYSYGQNVYYSEGNVYYGDTAVCTQEEYAQQAQSIATSVPEQIPDDSEWMSLGVFALTQDTDSKDSVTEPLGYLQMQVNKEGVIAGTLVRGTDDENTQVIEGMVDKESQRAAWVISGKTSPIMETGIYNLTKDEAPALLHFEDGTTQQWLMIRMEEPKEGAK